MSDDRMRAGQRLMPRYPGTGGDATPEDVEGHRLDEAPEGAGPIGSGGTPGEDQDDVEGHKVRFAHRGEKAQPGARRRASRQTNDEPDVEGHRIRHVADDGSSDALRLPTSGGEFITKLPPDSPHREG